MRSRRRRVGEIREFRRRLIQLLRKGSVSSYESHYATLPGALTTPDRGNLLRSMVCPIFLLYVEGQSATGGFSSTSDMLPSEKPSIDRPGTWTDHRQRAAKGRQNNCHILVTGACQGDPHLHDRD
jgi:hypothetical protein